MKFPIIIKTIIWLTLSTCLIPCFSQKKNFQSEFIFGLNNNSAGWLIGGVVFKKSVKVSDRAFRTFGLDIMNVKHPQEAKTQSYTGNLYIYGKINYLYSLRLQYGRDIILFEKANQSGVAIKLCGAVGFSLGIVSPYYIQLQQSFGGSIKNQKYDPKNSAHSYARILGPGFLLEGLGQSVIYPGLNAKIGLSFEVGTVERRVTGFEVGVLLDAYFKKIEFLVNAEKKALFPALYITIFYGSRR